MNRGEGASVGLAVTPKREWYVYIVRCADGTLYTGIAKDVARRLAEHNGEGRLGAKYTRARRPVELVYTEAWASRSAAARREHGIKTLTRAAKEALILGAPVSVEELD